MRHPTSPRELLIALAAAAVLAIVLTWPIAGRFSTAARIDTGDGRFSIWNVAWVAHALTTDPARLFDANIFHPHRNTLAFSEANLVAGLLAVPVWVVTKEPLAASNWTILCSFALSFLTMYALVRRLTGSVPAAALAAIHFAYAPFVLAHIPHIQLLMTFGLPLILLGLHRFVEAPTVRHAIWLGGAMGVQALASGYYGIFGGLMAGFGVLWFGIARGRWRDWRYWGAALAAPAVAAVFVAPAFVPYLEVQEAGFARTLDDARMYSAGWRSYVVSPLLKHRWIVDLVSQTGTWREVLFPGVLPIVFTVVAVVLGFRQPRPVSDPAARHVIGFYLALGALGGWASMGPDAGLYLVLHETMPFFGWLRAPARFGLLVTMALAILGGVGFAMLASMFTARARRGLVVGVLALALVRSTVGGLALSDLPPMALAHQRLVHLPRGAVAEFPFWSAGSERHRHTEYMLWSTFHWQPLINGYSDHIPAAMFVDMAHLETFPSPAAWRVLAERRARYVVMHWRYMPGGPETEALRDSMPQLRPWLRPIVEQHDASLYEIVAWPTPSP